MASAPNKKGTQEGPLGIYFWLFSATSVNTGIGLNEAPRSWDRGTMNVQLQFQVGYPLFQMDDAVFPRPQFGSQLPDAGNQGGCFHHGNVFLSLISSIGAARNRDVSFTFFTDVRGINGAAVATSPHGWRLEIISSGFKVPADIPHELRCDGETFGDFTIGQTTPLLLHQYRGHGLSLIGTGSA